MTVRSKTRKSRAFNLLSKPVHILALHGFTGRGEDFLGFTKLCESGIRWQCPDLPGHGPDLSQSCDIEAILHFISDQKPEKPRIALGYSMGARAALLHAVTYPEYWDALILVSGTAGIESDTERTKRKQQDDTLAERILRDGVDAFLRYWQQTPLIRSQQRIRPNWREQMQTNRRQHTAEGLAASLREFGQGSYPNLWPELDKLQCPVLLITGELDNKYCAIAKRMADYLPNAQWERVPDCGHMPHLEAPEQTALLIAKFKNTAFKTIKTQN